jgi:hypothetical protein
MSLPVTNRPGRGRTNLLNNCNKTGMFWANGDFDAGGVVNVADLTTLLNNYNKSLASVTNGGYDFDIVRVSAAIPEPTNLIIWSLLGTLAVTAGHWWRRKWLSPISHCQTATPTPFSAWVLHAICDFRTQKRKSQDTLVNGTGSVNWASLAGTFRVK